MALVPNRDGRVSQFEDTVVDFITKRRGCFILLTHDQAFVSALRTVLVKDMALASADMLIPVQESRLLTKEVMRADKLNMYPLLFIERSIDGQETGALISQLREAFPKLMIIMLTVEIHKHRLMYMHELGVDNFIAKPVSAATIIEKMAFTIKPQTKLGELIDEAKEYLENGNPERAKELAKDILDLKPGSAAGLMVLGDAECAMGNTDAAKEAYLEASRNADLYLEPLRKLAELSKRVGDLEESLSYLEKLDEMSPLNSERKINMGEINLDLGRGEQAHDLFETAITQISNSAMDHVALLAERVAAIYEKRDPEKAAQYYRKALGAKTKNLTRDDLRLFNRLGLSLRQQGKWEEAIIEYKSALEIDAKDSGVYYNMGMAYIEGKALADAVHCMQRALSLDSNFYYTSSGVAYNMGIIFMKGNHTEMAKKCFNAALEQEPGMKAAKQALGKL